MIPLPDTLIQDLVRSVGPARVHPGAPLSSLTTFRIGGPADCMVEVSGADELASVAAAAKRAGVPLTLLGGGSNVLVADEGIRGLVARVHGGSIELVGPSLVRADAGVTVNALVRWTVSRGCRGLEAWAGTPGTVGGAIAGNAHFRGRPIGDLVESVRLLRPGREAIDVSGADMHFSYDRSRVQRTGELVLFALFRVEDGADPAVLREVARGSLAYRKGTQPLRMASAGCIFQNPDPAVERLPDGVPASAGALIDRAGLKGRAVGAARVSATHANFIVNEGTATAADVMALIELCREEVLRRFGVRLKLEIRLLGLETVLKCPIS